MGREPEVEQLIEHIVTKLAADKAILVRSVEFGRLTWRKDRRGRIEVKIQPQL